MNNDTIKYLLDNLDADLSSVLHPLESILVDYDKYCRVVRSIHQGLPEDTNCFYHLPAEFQTFLLDGNPKLTFHVSRLPDVDRDIIPVFKTNLRAVYYLVDIVEDLGVYVLLDDNDFIRCFDFELPLRVDSILEVVNLGLLLHAYAYGFDVGKIANIYNVSWRIEDALNLSTVVEDDTVMPVFDNE